ncbi:hypothetical protein MRX96_052929 [Rhipicephalus microplus]
MLARKTQWYSGKPAHTALQEHANVLLKDFLPLHRFAVNQGSTTALASHHSFGTCGTAPFAAEAARHFLSSSDTGAEHTIVTSVLLARPQSIVRDFIDYGVRRAVRENVFLLEVYQNVLMVLVVLTFGASLLVAGMPWLAHAFIMDHVTDDFVVHYRDKADYKKTIDYLQTTLSCCGMTQAGYRDWQANVYFACNESNPSPERCSVPPSCCRHAPGQAVRRSAGNVLGGRRVIHLGGCGDAIFQTLRAHNLELVLIMLVLVAYLLLLNSLASSVQSQIRSLKRIYDKYYETVYHGQQSMVHAYGRCLRSYKARCTGALAANTPLSPAP